MKTYRILVYIIMLAGMGLHSCKLTITKRHYNKGYYINFDRGRSEMKSHKEDVMEETCVEKPEPVATRSPETVHAVEENGLGNAAKSITGKGNDELPLNPHSPKNRINTWHYYHAGTMNSPTAYKKVVRHKKVGEGVKNTKHEDAYHILAVIALVLLIVWLIGVLSGGWGLGLLLYLLLLVALVLLIIWLIQVI